MWVIVLACFSGAICRRWCHKTQRQRAVGSLKRRKYKKVVVREESAGDSKQEESANNHEANNCGCDPESQFDQDSCVICLSEFENGENVTTLPCGHDYHTECIKPWLLKRSSKCPICKASFVTKKKKKSRTGASSSTLDANSSTPLLGSGSNDDDAEGIIDNDEGEELESGSESEDIPEFDEENNYPAFWPSSVLGLSPGGLVLTAACTTGIGIAVAIVIFLLKSSEP